MNGIRIIDTLSYSTFHEVFNSAVVYICLSSADRVELLCSSSTGETIRKLIGRHYPQANLGKIRYRKIKVVERDDTVGGLLKYLLSGWLNVFYFLTAPRQLQLVYTNNNPLSLWWVSLLNLILRKNVIIFCHGELDLLIRHPKPFKPSFYYKYIFLLLFKYGLIGKHTRMCVLGGSILQNIQPFLNSKNRRNFFSIEHPYFFKSRSSNSNSTRLSTPLNIGTVGVMTQAKGLETLLRVSQLIDPLRICLRVVGRVRGFVDFGQYSHIDFLIKDRTFIEREKYETAIEQLDFILFLYPPDSYRFIASGALFDAMDMGKPIIYLANDYFNHVLKLPIGYACQTEDEIVQRLNELSTDPEKYLNDYRVFTANIEKLKSYYSADRIVL